MIAPFLIGLITALLQSAWLFAVLPERWGIYLMVGTIVYLFRFDLRRTGWRTAWWMGFWLDILSSWRFGVWIVICLMIAAVADLALPSSASGSRHMTSLWLCVVMSALLTLGLTLNQGWEGAYWWPLLGSTVFTSALYWISAQATLSWRIYD